MSKKTNDMRRELSEAKAYIGMIGKAQHHLSRSCGYLHTLSTRTQIGWQESPGSKNYWECSEFDKALGVIIQRRFQELAEAALKQMRSDYVKQRLSDKDDLIRQLAEIEALEEEQP